LENLRQLFKDLHEFYFKKEMDKKTKKELSREIGLEVGYLCGNYFLKMNHLHYGYWTDDLPVDITNLHIAQDKYAELIISNIPKSVKTILDVGCGTGQIDKMLIDKGYKVDCLSPSHYLNNQIKNLLGDKSNIFESTYEELQTEKRYDMILFCESFQYIDINKSLTNTYNFLNKNGYMLICDIFKKDVEGKSALSGGHKLSRFHDLISENPFKLIESIDITEQTAPNMDLMNDVVQNVIRPSINAGLKLSNSRHPTAVKVIKWFFRKKIEKLKNKYCNQDRTGEEFKKFKLYQLLLYQKND
jgi:2-polyprenyl-3-methyl-5-hydroxy-6-metoxy-1,4-benzoquinol methylase